MEFSASTCVYLSGLTLQHIDGIDEYRADSVPELLEMLRHHHPKPPTADLLRQFLWDAVADAVEGVDMGHGDTVECAVGNWDMWADVEVETYLREDF